MKAILVNSLSTGGGEKIALEIYNELKKSEKVKIIVLENRLDYAFHINDNNDITILKNKFGKFLGLFYYAYQLRKLVIKEDINYIQSHLYRSNFVNILCKILYNCDYFAQIVNHGDPYQYRLSTFSGVVNRILIKTLYIKSDSIIVISKLMKVNLKRMLKHKCNIRVVNNAYGIKDILLKSNDVSNQMKLPEKYYVSIGRLISLKKINILLQSVSALKYNIVIIGDGPEMSNLQELAFKLNIEDKVTFTGQLNNPYYVIKKAKGYIGCSESEGFPNAIIESLILSIPVIHSDCISGPREILSPSSEPDKLLSNGFELADYGILYCVGDVNALNNSINYLEENKDFRDSIINKGFKRAMKFDSSNIVKQYFL